MVSLFFLTKTLPQRDLSHWGFNFLQVHQGSVAREDHPSLSLTPLHGLPLTLASRLCYGRARILTRSSNASVVWMMLSSPQASKPPSSVQGSSWFPRQVNISLPIFPCPAPKTWFEDGRRVNEDTSAWWRPPSSHFPPSQVPEGGDQAPVSDQSPLLALSCDVRSGKWSMRKRSRHEVRGEEKRDSILRSRDELKMLLSCGILRVSAPGWGRLLSRESAFSRSVRTEPRLRTEDCSCWCWGSCWQQFVTDLGADVWS